MAIAILYISAFAMNRVRLQYAHRMIQSVSDYTCVKDRSFMFEV